MGCECKECGNEYVSREGLLCLLELLKLYVDKSIVDSIKDEAFQNITFSNQDILDKINIMLANGSLVSDEELSKVKETLLEKVDSVKADINTKVAEEVSKKVDEKITGPNILSPETANEKFVKKTGDTMTGPLATSVLVLKNGSEQIELFL